MSEAHQGGEMNGTTRVGETASAVTEEHGGSSHSVLFYVAVAALFWFTWALGIAPLLADSICSRGEHICARLGQIGDLFGGINALFAGFAFAGLFASIEQSKRAASKERRLAHDRAIFEQLCKSYEWAFQALSKNSEGGPPLSDRMAWLTAARHILRARSLQAEISTSTYKLLHQENLEYWKFKFHELLDDPSLRTLNYFSMENPDGGEREHNIHYVSAAVIADFVIWSGPDPLDDFDVHKALETPGFKHTHLGRGVEGYLVQLHPVFTEEHLRRKAAQK